MHATADPHLVEIRNLSVRFKLDDAEVEAVRDISFHIGTYTDQDQVSNPAVRLLISDDARSFSLRTVLIAPAV